MNDFYRIRRLPPYLFAEVNVMKAEARARGENIIDFGIGNPDLPTPEHIVDKLFETAADSRTHRYSQSNPPLRIHHRGGSRTAHPGGPGIRLHDRVGTGGQA